MPTLEEKLQYHDLEKYKFDNGEYFDIMRPSFVSSMDVAINDFRSRMDQLAKCYKEYYQNGQKMYSDKWKEDFGRDAHTLKGQANLNYIQKMFEPMAKLQKAIDNDVKNDIDKYMYEVFAFRKKYLECIYAIKEEDIDEPEFDLRQFDEFTGLNLAQVYQSIPINSKSLTFNQVGSQSIINNMEPIGLANNKLRNDNNENVKTLISETVNEKVELIKCEPDKKLIPNEGEEQRNINIIGEIKSHNSPDSIYTFAKQQRERGYQLFMLRRPQISSEDLPIDSSLTCSIF